MKELLVRVIGKKRDGHGRMKQEGRTKKWTMEGEAAVSDPRKVGATMFLRLTQPPLYQPSGNSS